MYGGVYVIGICLITLGVISFLLWILLATLWSKPAAFWDKNVNSGEAWGLTSVLWISTLGFIIAGVIIAVKYKRYEKQQDALRNKE